MRLTVPLDLIEAARRAEPEGMERLLRAFWPHAYRIARSIVHNDALAEDAAQEACAIIYRELSRLRASTAFRTWAYRIVAREAVRVAKVYVAWADPASSELHDPDTSIDVFRALNALSPDLRAIVVLHYYAGMSSGEIARGSGVPSPTVRFRLAQARRRLKELLGDDVAYSSRTAQGALL